MCQQTPEPTIRGFDEKLKVHYLQGFNDELNGEESDLGGLDSESRGAYHQGKEDAKCDPNLAKWTP